MFSRQRGSIGDDYDPAVVLRFSLGGPGNTVDLDTGTYTGALHSIRVPKQPGRWAFHATFIPEADRVPWGYRLTQIRNIPFTVVARD